MSSTTTITSRISDHVRSSLERSRRRREHDEAMTDPRIRDEHYAGRLRDTAAGGPDCEFCA